MSFGKKSYMKPTPRNLLKLGVAIRGIGTTITGAGILSDNKVMAIIALVVMILGEFLIDFFGEDEKKDD